MFNHVPLALIFLVIPSSTARHPEQPIQLVCLGCNGMAQFCAVRVPTSHVRCVDVRAGRERTMWGYTMIISSNHHLLVTQVDFSAHTNLARRSVWGCKSVAAQDTGRGQAATEFHSSQNNRSHHGTPFRTPPSLPIDYIFLSPRETFLSWSLDVIRVPITSCTIFHDLPLLRGCVCACCAACGYRFNKSIQHTRTLTIPCDVM
jgi:hypothetical protein